MAIPAPTVDPGEETESVKICLPRAPGCTELLEAPALTTWMLKYHCRVNANITTASKAHVIFGCIPDPDSVLDYTLPDLTNDWDHSSTDSHRQPSYPDDGHDFTEEWNRDICLPSSLCGLSFYVEDTMVNKTINGATIGVRWDNANPGENVPIWDWSSPGISDTQMPASSCVVMKALCETYNRILYGAIWEIGAAFPSSTIAAV